MAQRSATDTVSLHVRLCDFISSVSDYCLCHFHPRFYFYVSLLRNFVYILIIHHEIEPSIGFNLICMQLTFIDVILVLHYY